LLSLCIYASSALGFGVTNTTSIPVIAGLSCDPECSIDASLECRYEHKQRNNDSKIGCVLNQNYQRPRLPVVDSRVRFAIPPRGGAGPSF
ncbi:MAG: hypothetical protein WBX78_02570, partial [Pseudolabrys sp.]